MKKAISVLISLIIAVSAFSAFSVNAVGISYSFKYNTAGYAEGTVTLNASSGTYWLYWADDSKALDGYRQIAKLTVSGSASYKMPAQTAIPADASKLVAFNSSSEPADKSVSSAAAVYTIPNEKRLAFKTSDRKYRFASYSDVHIDSAGINYKYDKIHLKKAFNTAAARNADFAVLSGDYVNNNIDYLGISKSEWKTYQKILAESDFCNPVYEAVGNHELWQSVSGGTADFIKGTGLDGDKSSSDKAYFEKTLGGDHFIFMALEGGFYPDRTEEFTDAQLSWLRSLLEKYSGDGKNIYIIEHSLFYKYGAGDRVDGKPYYDIPLSDDQKSTRELKAILEEYKDVIFISGHTHIAFDEQYNYSDNGGKSAQMIHNSSVGGVRHVNSDGSLNKDYREDDSEGYIVDVFDDAIIFNGTALYYNMYDPNCCYIVKTSKQVKEGVTAETNAAQNTTASSAVTPTSSKSTAPSTTSQSPYYLKGSFNAWSTANPLYYTTESGLLSATLKLTANTYKFKINTSSTWYGNEGIVEDTTKKNSNGGWLFETGKGDCTLKATGGYYTFTFNTVNHKVNIYYSVSDPYATEPPEVPTTEKPTEPPTEKPTEKPTEPATDKPTEKPTEPATDKPTEKPTEPATDKATEKPTEPVTDKATEKPTEPVTDKATEKSTEAVTDKPTEKPTQAPTTDAPTDIGSWVEGDANHDYTVNIKDATAVQKYAAKLVEFDDYQKIAADVNYDGIINVKDATLIQKFVAKLINSFEQDNKSKTKAKTGVSSLSEVKSNLDLYYRYSSYDSYQALKKEYFKQKSSSSPDYTELTSLNNKLLSVVDPENVDGESEKITVYFENSKNWSAVKAYVWGTGGKEKEWSGNAMTKLGRNEYNHYIYSYTVDTAKYQSIIFNNGTEQTKDISLTADKVCYYPNSDSSPYTVSSYPFKDSYIIGQ